jgi:RND superfamily putative drug exporter
MYRFLGWLAATHPWKVCAAWILLGALVTCTAPRWDTHAQDDDIRFLPARCDSVRGYQLLREAFPQDVFASRVIFAVERSPGRLNPADFRLVDELVADLNQLRKDAPELQITRVSSHGDPFLGNRLISADGQCTLIQVSLGTPYLALQTRATVDRADAVLRARLARVGADAPALYTTGPAGVGRDLLTAGGTSLDNTTLATILLVIAILLLVYRAPLLALVPLATIAAATWVALKFLTLCTLIPGFILVNISQVFAVVMLYGAGTDYCLFLIGRYREELAHGLGCDQALARSVGAVGEALAASAGTVICGLGLMGLAEFAKVRCGGPAIAVGLAVALAASLTLAPALLRLSGRFAFWPTGLPRRPAGPGRTTWDWLSRQVVARPVLVWCAALAALLPLAWVGLHVKASYRATSELSAACNSVRGLDAIQRHFVAGEVGPVTILLESPWTWETREGKALIASLGRGFQRLDGVAEVRSLTQPLGEPLSEPPPPPQAAANTLRGSLFQAVWRNVAQGIAGQVQRGARDVYLARVAGDDRPDRHVTRLDVVLKSDPFEARSLATLELLQIWLKDELPRWAGPRPVRAECYGVTVNARDLAEVTEGDRVRINSLVLAGVFLILLVIVRRLWLAAYLLGTVLLSYYTALGATTLMAHWWLGRPLGEVDWRVLFFLFTILVAVGEDYNILLMTRALQERKRHGPAEGMRRALAHTGGVITSCGLIMAGTFATLMLAGLSTLIQIGFALAFGVLLDTFIVRPFLVPALTIWVWSRESDSRAEVPALLPFAQRQRRAA